MKRRQKLVAVVLVLALLLTTIAGQIASAGTGVRCGSYCQTTDAVNPSGTGE